MFVKVDLSEPARRVIFQLRGNSRLFASRLMKKLVGYEPFLRYNLLSYFPFLSIFIKHRRRYINTRGLVT